MDNRFFDRLVEMNTIPADRSTRSETSRRMEARQISQRQMWGELKPGQRSIHEPGWF